VEARVEVEDKGKGERENLQTAEPQHLGLVERWDFELFRIGIG